MDITVGLAGAGRRAAEVHAPAIASCPGLVFAGVWAPSPKAARELAESHGVRAFARYDELIDRCDAIVYAVPPATQAELAVLAMPHVKAVLLDRPIAGDLAGAEELAMAATSARVLTQLALTWRYSSTVREFLTTEVRRTRPQGGSGRFVSAPPVESASPLRAERSVLRNLGPDLIDLLDAALGRTVAVHAHGDPSGWMGLLLEHRGGRFSEASLYATRNVGSHRAAVEVFGPGGVAAVDFATAVGRDAHDTMIAEFAESAARNRAHELDVHHGLHLQQLIEAADTELLAGQ